MHRACALYDGGGTQEKLLVRYASFIDRIARRMSHRVGMPSTFDDLWSAGALGLLDAARRFDRARDVKFESFAEHRIRGAMIDELREMDHLPRRMRSDADKVRKARTLLGNKLGREPNTDKLTLHLGIPIEDVKALEALSSPAAPLAPELQLPSLDSLQDESIDHTERVARLTKAIAQLSLRLQTVLSLHYVEGFTYKEISGALQVSEARVCQLHGEAVKKLRATLTEEENS